MRPTLFATVLVCALAGGCATLPDVSAREVRSLGNPRNSQGFGPFRADAAPVTRDARDAPVPTLRLPGSDPLYFAFQVYQATLSATDGPRCAHAPTCSAYGVQAVRRHPVLGFAFTVDRLWRAGRSSDLRPMPTFHPQPGLTRYFDPLDASDFWLRGVRDDHAPEYLPTPVRQ